MPELPNTQHELFARRIADGASQIDAYLQAYPGTDSSLVRTKASRLVRQPDIENRIGDLLEQSADEAIWALSERLDYCQAAAETPYSAIDENHPLCQGVKHTAHGTEYKTPNKLQAVALYNKLSGDRDAAQSPNRNLLGEMIGAIRSKQWSTEAEERGDIPKPPAKTCLSNYRHERFAQLVGSGERPSYAYQKIYDVRSGTARIEGYRLSQRPEVKERIQQIRGVASALSGWLRPQRMRYLRGMAETPISQITEDSPYCQGIKRTRDGVEIKVPNKLQAVHLYSQLADQRQKQNCGKTIEQVVTNMRNDGDFAVANGIEKSLLAYVADTVR